MISTAAELYWEGVLAFAQAGRALCFPSLISDISSSCTSHVLTGKDEKMVTVRLHACPSSGLFKPSRFYPSKNNVRTAWFMEQSTPKEGVAWGWGSMGLFVLGRDCPQCLQVGSLQLFLWAGTWWLGPTSCHFCTQEPPSLQPHTTTTPSSVTQ